jgi:hypothetical protein
MRSALLSAVCCAAACAGGDIGDRPLSAAPLTAQLMASGVELSDAAGFADERGGGIFVDSDKHAVRLRIDGSRGALESHPGNSEPPGEIQRVLPAGPFSALVIADNGLYIAEDGWLIEPAWRDALSAQGVVAAALGGDGVVWIAHQQGLFHIEAGELAELKLAGQSIHGLRALAVAPAPNGAPAVWFAQGEQLSFAAQTARTSYAVSDGGLSGASLSGGIVALAGISAAPNAPGELWLMAAHGLFQHVAGHWGSLDAPSAPEALLSAGRFLWLRAGSALYRYDADSKHWAELQGALQSPKLLAADASGCVWARVGAASFAITPGEAPRVQGLFEGTRVYDADVRVRVQIPVSEQPSSVRFKLDEAEPVERSLAQAVPGEGAVDTLAFALGGFDAAGREQTYSLASLKPGLHTLTVDARANDAMQSRRLHFELRSGSAVLLSFDKDVKPIFESRCAKCHASGPGHELKTYAEWMAQKDQIVSAVTELRMPADGPLDPSQIELLQRWAAGGAAP